MNRVGTFSVIVVAFLGVIYFLQSRFDLWSHFEAAKHSFSTSSFTAKQTQEVWRTLRKPDFSCETYDYKDQGGARNFWCTYASTLSLKFLQQAVGEPAFLKGPHKKDHPNLNSFRDFGRYNPKFVSQLSNLVLPNRDSELKKYFQHYYDGALKRLARIYLQAYITLESDKSLKSSELALYKRFIDSSSLKISMHQRYDTYSGDSWDPAFSPAVAFWLRRNIDATEDEFYIGLRRLLSVFDPSALEDTRPVEVSVRPVKESKSGDGRISGRLDTLGEKSSAKRTGSGSPENIAKKAFAVLASSKNQCANIHDYFPYGAVRILYCHILNVTSYSSLQEMIGMPIFKSGPHTSTTLNLESQTAFGHYRPDFVRWIDKVIVTALIDPDFIKANKSVWENKLRISARVFLNVAQMMKRSPETVSALHNHYIVYMGSPSEFKYPPHSGYWEYMPRELDDQGIGGPALGFWMRRRIDGTADLFQSALEKIVLAYEPKMMVDSVSSKMRLRNL